MPLPIQENSPLSMSPSRTGDYGLNKFNTLSYFPIFNFICIYKAARISLRKDHSQQPNTWKLTFRILLSFTVIGSIAFLIVDIRIHRAEKSHPSPSVAHNADATKPAVAAHDADATEPAVAAHDADATESAVAAHDTDEDAISAILSGSILSALTASVSENTARPSSPDRSPSTELSQDEVFSLIASLDPDSTSSSPSPSQASPSPSQDLSQEEASRWIASLKQASHLPTTNTQISPLKVPTQEDLPSHKPQQPISLAPSIENWISTVNIQLSASKGLMSKLVDSDPSRSNMLWGT